MAAELKLVHPNLKITLVHSRDQLLSSEPLPKELKSRTLELVHAAGVDTLLSHRLDATDEAAVDDLGNPCVRLCFTNGHTLLADHVVMAISRSIPSTSFLPKTVLDDQGYVRIQANLAFPPSEDGDDGSKDEIETAHFAVGDITRWSSIKRCGGAMHMGYLAAHNIHQCMRQRLRGTEPAFLELDEIIPPMIGLAVGKQAVAYWPEGGVTSGEDTLKTFFGDDLGFTSEFLFFFWSYVI